MPDVIAPSMPRDDQAYTAFLASLLETEPSTQAVEHAVHETIIAAGHPPFGGNAPLDDITRFKSSMLESLWPGITARTHEYQQRTTAATHGLTMAGPVSDVRRERHHLDLLAINAVNKAFKAAALQRNTSPRDAHGHYKPDFRNHVSPVLLTYHNTSRHPGPLETPAPPAKHSARSQHRPC